MLLELAATVVHLVQRSLFVLVVRYDTNNCILSPLIADVVKRVESSRVSQINPNPKSVTTCFPLKVNWLTIILNKSMISRSCGRKYSKGRIVGLYPAAKRQMLQYYTVYLTSYWYSRSSSEQLTCCSAVSGHFKHTKNELSQDTKRRTFLCKLYSQY